MPAAFHLKPGGTTDQAGSKSKLTFTLILIVGVLTVGPIAMLLLGSFSKGLTAFGSFTLDKYIEAYTDPAFLEVIINTMIFVLGSSFMATVLALFLAWLLTSLILLSANGLKRFLGRRGLIAMERLMGMLLIALSVQMLLEGFSAYIAGVI